MRNEFNNKAKDYANGRPTYPKEILDKLIELGIDKNSNIYFNLSGTLLAPNETNGSIISVFKQKIQLFASRANLSEMLANNDFDMRDIGRKKTAVFIVIQDEKTTYHALATIFIKQCYYISANFSKLCKRHYSSIIIPTRVVNSKIHLCICTYFNICIRKWIPSYFIKTIFSIIL